LNDEGRRKGGKPVSHISQSGRFATGATKLFSLGTIREWLPGFLFFILTNCEKKDGGLVVFGCFN
jgi:hypothetical protein